MTVSGGRPAWSPSPSALPLPSRLDRKKKFVFRAPLNLTGDGWLFGGFLLVIATFGYLLTYLTPSPWSAKTKFSLC